MNIRPREPTALARRGSLVHLRHIAAQDRRQIGVHDRRIAAADQLDQWRDLVADRHLREAISRASAATRFSCSGKR